eukprot:6145906-Prymnesium_polylepis.1
MSRVLGYRVELQLYNKARDPLVHPRAARDPARVARRPLPAHVPHVGRSQKTARTVRVSAAGVVSAKGGAFLISR